MFLCLYLRHQPPSALTIRHLPLRQRLELVCQREERKLIVLYVRVLCCQSRTLPYSAL